MNLPWHFAPLRGERVTLDLLRPDDLAALSAIQGDPATVRYMLYEARSRDQVEAAIERDSVAAAFKRKDIAVLRGDYTRRSPEIARFLAYHKRPGVPLYLFYPAKGKPRILPQILTAGMLTELE